MRKFENRPNPTTTFCLFPGHTFLCNTPCYCKHKEQRSADMSQSRGCPGGSFRSRGGGRAGVQFKACPWPTWSSKHKKFPPGFQYKISAFFDNFFFKLRSNFPTFFIFSSLFCQFFSIFFGIFPQFSSLFSLKILTVFLAVIPHFWYLWARI